MHKYLNHTIRPGLLPSSFLPLAVCPACRYRRTQSNMKRWQRQSPISWVLCGMSVDRRVHPFSFPLAHPLRVLQDTIAGRLAIMHTKWNNVGGDIIHGHSSLEAREFYCILPKTLEVDVKTSFWLPKPVTIFARRTSLENITSKST